MSFSDNYWKLVEEDEKKKKRSSSSTSKMSAPVYVNKTAALYNDDLAPVRTKAEPSSKKKETAKKTNKSEEKERKWFQKGAFEDGYQFGDISKTLLYSGRDLKENLVAGALGIAEKTIDAGAYLVGGVGGLFGADKFKDKTAEFIKKDIIDEEKIAKSAPMNAISPTGVSIPRLLSEIILQKNDTDANSVFGEKSDSLVQSGGQLAGQVGLQAVGVPWFVTSGVTSFGAETEESLKDGASYGKAGLSGAISSGAEILTEKLFGGSGLGEKGLINLEPLTKGISNKVVKALADYGLDIAAEGAEEVVAEVTGNLASALYKEENLGDLLFSEEALDAYLESFIGGAVLGGGMNVGKVSNSISTGRDYRTDLTSSEQKVFNHEYESRIAEAEKDGKKLSNKEKSKIYDEVMDDMENGSISTDTIEEVLGGDTYKTYKETVDTENASMESMQKEYDALNEEYQPLYKMKQMEKSDADIDRATELKSKMDALKQKMDDAKNNSKQYEYRSNLDNEMMGIVNGSRLAESYREKARRGEDYQADMEKYKGRKYEDAAKTTLENVIKLGMNNTRGVRNLVDFLANSSADTGLVFELKTGEQIKAEFIERQTKLIADIENIPEAQRTAEQVQKLAEMQDALKAVQSGKRTVNGDISGNTVVLNLDSAKALNRVVGHEIMHSLEKSKHAKNLQNALYAFAKTKGIDIDAQVKDTAKTYAGIKADVEREVIADMIGDYLFTDSDFVSHLHNTDRNLFQKIWDEIKYLYKIATAGSKEFKQFEKLKREFERVYKEGGKQTEATAEADTQYSVSDNSGKTLTKGQQEYFKDSKMRDDDGNLMVMYHGSQNAGFHVFDANKSDDGRSFFFVDRNDVAASYSGTSETYEAKTIRTAADMNNFLAEIGYDQYEAVEKNGKFELLENGEHVADSDTAQGIYEEFCWYEGVGEGDANYKVYLNLKNPLVVDAQGRNWNNISREYSQEIADRYKSLTAEEKAALSNLAEWGEYSIFRDEMLEARANAEQGVGGVFDEAYTKNLASAYEKLGGANANLFDAFSIATENFSEEAINQFAVKQMNTRDYAKQAKEQGYDGVIFKNIHDNGGYSNGSEGASTVAIAFDSNQIKSVANENPTGDKDIRYSVSELDGKPIDPARFTKEEADTSYSLTFNKDIEKGQSDYIVNRNSYITDDELKEAHRVTSAMVDVMMEYSDILPEDKIGKVLTKNGSYDRSVENTTICVRTLAYNEFVDKVQEKIGRPLTQMESFLVSQKMYDIATDPQCLYCYVSLDRKSFNDMLLRYMTDRDTVIDKYKNSDRSPEAISKLYEEFLNGRKDTKPMKDRFNTWLGYVDNGTQLLSLADIATEERQSEIKAKGGILSSQLADARKYAQSASWSKIQKDYVAYRDEILKLGDKVVKNLNEHYGLRWYSFSDYSAAFIVENMQQITDASIRGLKGLGYTKDTDFAEIFAPSGMNINVSVFVNVDENGNFYIDEKQSANFEKAKELRAKYPNVGIVATVTNDDALRWAAEQEWSDVIIPFHIVRTGADVAEYYKWLNYTSESADTIKDNDLWSAYVDSLNLKSEGARKKVSKNIYPSEHKNDKATYLALCENRGLSPRFARFAGEDWYMKLVNETRLSADNSSALKPVYNLEAAKSSFQRFVDKGGYEGGWYKDGTDVDAEASAVADDVLSGKKPNEVSYGRQDIAPLDIMASRKTNRKHGQLSMSKEGDVPVKYGDFNIYGKDLMLEKEAETVEDFAPVVNAENATTTQDIAPVAEIVSGEEAFANITDADAPAEMEAPMPETEEVTVDDPFESRDYKEVGNRNVKSFADEHPEVKPFFQSEAEVMLGELRDSTKGERWYNDDVYYQSGGEKGWSGTHRETSEEIAYLLDYGYTYSQIEKGLQAIIDGTTSNATTKRIEFALNSRLLNGYTDFRTDTHVPPNQDYRNVLNGMQTTEHNAQMAEGLTDADVPPVTEDIAPVQQTAPVQPKTNPVPPKKPPVQNNNAQPKKGTPKTAQIVYGAKEQAKKKISTKAWVDEHVFRRGAAIEDLALETGNREVYARYDNIRRAENAAQHFIANGADGVPALKGIYEGIEKIGKRKAFDYYLAHMLNVDRMSIETPENRATRESLAEKFKGYSEKQIEAIAMEWATKNTPEDAATRIKDARAYLDSLKSKNMPVFGDEWTADMSRNAAALILKQNPEIKPYVDDMYAIPKHLREEMVENGLIDRKTADMLEKKYPHYVPIHRTGKDGLAVNVPLDSNRTGVNNPIKKATGGNSDFYTFADTMAERIEQTYRAIAKNRFGVELKNTLKPAIKEDTSKKESANVDMDSLLDSMEAGEGLLKEGKNGEKPTFTIFEKGKRVEFEISDEIYEALKPSNFTYNNKALNMANEIRKGLVTTYSPKFAVNNPIKDTADVMINSQHPMRTYWNYGAAVKSLITKDKYYQERMSHGGGQDSVFDAETKTFEKTKLAEALASNKFIQKAGIPVKKWVAAQEFIEQVPRMAEYIASRKMGRSIDVSMLDSGQVTTNFGATGDLTNMLNRNGFTFLGASVEGFNQQIRNIRQAKYEGAKGWAKLAGKYIAAGLPALLLNHALWDDDEEYEELSDYVKANYYIVAKFGDGKFVRIPKGRVSACVQEAFNQMKNLVTGDDEVDFNTFADLVVTNIAPANPGEQNLLAPLWQAVVSEKTWYGDDMIPTRLKDLPAGEQFDETTDSFSRWLGDTFNISPIKANYVIDQYSGVIGDIVLPMMTPKAESGDDSFLGKMIAPVRDAFTTDSVLKNQNVSDFYEKSDELTTNAKSMYATDEDILMSKYMGSVNAEMGELYGKKREIQNSNLPNAEKYKQVRDIQKQINELAEDGLATHENVRINGRLATVGDRHYHMNKDGEWEKTTDAQLKKYNFLKDNGVSYDDYYEADKDTKEKYDGIYSWYKEASEEDPGKIALGKAVASNIVEYRTYASDLNDIRADKYSNGKSISGSAKKKKLEYINSLDLDYGQKIILYRSYYDSKADKRQYNGQILEYLNSRDDLSYEDRVAILLELDFKVDENGYATW